MSFKIPGIGSLVDPKSGAANGKITRGALRAVGERIVELEEAGTAAHASSHLAGGSDPFAPTWTSYTPTLTQNGAVTKTVTLAQYIVLGKIVFVEVDLAVTGSGTAANDILVGLPTGTPTMAANGALGGAGLLVDASSSTRYNGPIRVMSTVTFGIQSTGNGVLGTAGFTAALASGDRLTANFMYGIA